MPAGDGFLEDELFCDDNPVLLRVVQEQTLLRIRREFGLIRGADADVESTIFGYKKNTKTNVLLVWRFRR